MSLWNKREDGVSTLDKMDGDIQLVAGSGMTIRDDPLAKPSRTITLANSSAALTLDDVLANGSTTTRSASFLASAGAANPSLTLRGGSGGSNNGRIVFSDGTTSSATLTYGAPGSIGVSPALRVDSVGAMAGTAVNFTSPISLAPGQSINVDTFRTDLLTSRTDGANLTISAQGSAVTIDPAKTLSATTAVVGTASVTTANVTGATIGTATITTANLTNASVGTMAVTTATISNGTITTASMGSATMTTATVTTGKFGSASVYASLSDTNPVLSLSNAIGFGPGGSLPTDLALTRKVGSASDYFTGQALAVPTVVANTFASKQGTGTGQSTALAVGAAADTAIRLRIDDSGSIKMGSGSAAPDVSISRFGPNTIRLDALNVTQTGTANWGNGTDQPLATLGPGGLSFGPGGSAAPDVTLSRVAASTLRATANKFCPSGTVWLGDPAAANPQAQLSTSALSFGPGGTPADFLISRTGVGQAQITCDNLSITMRTGLTLAPVSTTVSTQPGLSLGQADLFADQLVSSRNNPGGTGSDPYGLRLKLAGDSSDRVGVKNQGAIAFGPGLSAPDVELSRSATQTLKCSGTLEADELRTIAPTARRNIYSLSQVLNGRVAYITDVTGAIIVGYATNLVDSTDGDVRVIGNRLNFQNVRDDILYRFKLTTGTNQFAISFLGQATVSSVTQNGTAFLDDNLTPFPILSTFDLRSKLASTLLATTGSAIAEVTSQSVMAWDFLGSDIPASAKTSTGWRLFIEGMRFNMTGTWTSPNPIVLTYGVTVLEVTEVPVFNASRLTSDGLYLPCPGIGPYAPSKLNYYEFYRFSTTWYFLGGAAMTGDLIHISRIGSVVVMMFPASTTSFTNTTGGSAYLRATTLVPDRFRPMNDTITPISLKYGASISGGFALIPASGLLTMTAATLDSISSSPTYQQMVSSPFANNASFQIYGCSISWCVDFDRAVAVSGPGGGGASGAVDPVLSI